VQLRSWVWSPPKSRPSLLLPSSLLLPHPGADVALSLLLSSAAGELRRPGPDQTAANYGIDISGLNAFLATHEYIRKHLNMTFTDTHDKYCWLDTIPFLSLGLRIWRYLIFLVCPFWDNFDPLYSLQGGFESTQIFARYSLLSTRVIT
jgi:hypothetical protein